MNILKKATAIAIAFLLMTVAISACDKNNIDSDESDISLPDITVVNKGYPVHFGNTVIQKSPEKIASLSPALTEILVELGFQERLILRSEYCDYPETITDLPTAGHGANPDIAKILSEKPEYVFTFSPISEKDTLSLADQNIQVINFQTPKTIENLKSIYMALGIVFYGNTPEAAQATQFFDEAYSPLLNAEISLGNFAYITTGMRLSGNQTLESDLLSRYGSNIVGDGEYSDDLSILADKTIDVLLVSDEYTLEQIQANEVLSKLKAVTEGKVIFLPNARFEKPSARMVTISDLIKQ